MSKAEPDGEPGRVDVSPASPSTGFAAALGPLSSASCASAPAALVVPLSPPVRLNGVMRYDAKVVTEGANESRNHPPVTYRTTAAELQEAASAQNYKDNWMVRTPRHVGEKYSRDGPKLYGQVIVAEPRHLQAIPVSVLSRVAPAREYAWQREAGTLDNYARGYYDTWYPTMRRFPAILPLTNPETWISVLEDVINCAEFHIIVSAYSYDHVRLTNALVDAANRGVLITMCVDVSQFNNASSIHMKDQLSKISDAVNCRSVRVTGVEQRSVFVVTKGTYSRRGTGGLHTKYLIADAQLAVLGSANFSHNSFRNQMEAGMLCKAQNLVSELLEMFYQTITSEEVIGRLTIK